MLCCVAVLLLRVTLLLVAALSAQEFFDNLTVGVSLGIGLRGKNADAPSTSTSPPRQAGVAQSDEEDDDEERRLPMER